VRVSFTTWDSDAVTLKPLLACFSSLSVCEVFHIYISFFFLFFLLLHYSTLWCIKNTCKDKGEIIAVVMTINT